MGSGPGVLEMTQTKPQGGAGGIWMLWRQEEMLLV